MVTHCWGIVVSNTIIAAILAVVVAFLGRIWRHPAALHFLWVLVLAKLVTPPLISLPILLPASDAPLLAEGLEPSHDNRDALSDATATARVDQLARTTDTARSTSAAQPSVTDFGSALSLQPPRMAWLTIMAWAWGIGGFLMASAHVVRILRFQPLLRAATPAARSVVNMAVRISWRMRLKPVPEILLLPVRVTPSVWFLGGRPRVLLPAGLFERLDAQEQEAILAHELGHIRRKDHWVRLLELLVSTLFWWNPVVWWACRMIRDLEEQCCDGLVLGALPHGARAYANALIDTLDFLSERSLAVPSVATRAVTYDSIERRIKMLRVSNSLTSLSRRRMAFMLAISALPMSIAFAAQPGQDGPSTPVGVATPARAAVERHPVNKLVKDFPEKAGLSTPEASLAAYNRASAGNDAKAVLELGWWRFGPQEIREVERFWSQNPPETAIYKQALLDSEILEVLTYRDDYAAVVSKLKFPVEGAGRYPFSSRAFGRIDGVWRNLGEDRLPSVEMARNNFDRKKDRLWQAFVKVRDGVKNGKPLSAHDGSADETVRNAAGEQIGISIVKADLIGRVEWWFLHNARDITARKSIEWGEVQTDKEGNRTIRYKYYATIWDKDVYVMNQVFSFDSEGNILRVDDIKGFPQKKPARPSDVCTQAGMKELVEDFFSKNFRDVTSRETIEWGDVAKAENGNSSIRYKYRATIWDKDTKNMDQTFTFNPKGEFVSVKDVSGFPQKPPATTAK